MNTRQLYRLIHRSAQGLNINEPLPDSFNYLKNSKNSRIILRMANATSLEEKLYGNTSDHIAVPSKEEILNNFKKINKRYGYLDGEKDFQQFLEIYYITQLALLNETECSGYTKLYLSYQILVCFGRASGEVEDVFDRFDKYCTANNLKQHTSVFPKKLTTCDRPIQLDTWRKIITDSNSPEAMSFFYSAREIEKFLGRTPYDLAEAKFISKISVSNKLWNFNQLVEIFPELSTETAQLNFIDLLTEENILNCSWQFVQIFELIKSAEIQKELLHRTPLQLLRKVCKDFGNRYVFRCIHSDNKAYLIDIIGIENLMPLLITSFDLLGFIKENFPQHNKLDLFDKIASNARCYLLLQDHFNDFLPYVNPEQKLDFLLKIVGKEKCFYSVEHFGFSQVLAHLKPQDQVTFIQQVVPAEKLPKLITKILYSIPTERFKLLQQLIPKVDDLKNLQKDYKTWQELKLTLSPEDRVLLNQFVYTAEDLQAKSILKNIKQTIQQTPWPTTDVHTFLGNKQIQVPKSVHAQVSIFAEIKGRKKTHVAGLKEIKQMGSLEALTKSTSSSPFSFLYTKDQTEENYFEQFKSEENFNKAFGMKKS